jgi:GGDEF domain-containing protein
MVTAAQPSPAPAAPAALANAPDAPLTRRVDVATEVAMWFLLLVLIEHCGLGTGIGYVGIEPSPLWFPIVWAALRGGLSAGLVAAAAAGVLYALGYAADVGIDATLLVAPAVAWPLTLFAGVAFLIGQARDRIDAERTRQQRIAENWKREAKRQKHDIDLLRHVNTELKRRIFDRSFDFEGLMASMARSSGSDNEKAFDATLGMLVDFCGASKCSVLYVLPGGVLDLAAHRGWTDDEIRTRLQTAAHERVQRALAEARPFVALGDDDLEQGGALFVSPLADASGVIKAVLCIDDLPPARFDQTTVKTFLGIASWMATNLRRVELGATTEEHEAALDAEKAIGTPEQLSERIFLDDARRTRYRVETALVAVRVPDVHGATAEKVEMLEGQVTAILAANVGMADDVFRFGFAGCYLLVLTGCNRRQAEPVVERLRYRFAVAAQKGTLGPVELQLFTPDQDAPRLAALLPRIAQHFFGEPVAGLDQHCPVPEPSAQRSGNARDFANRVRLELDLAKRFRWDLSVLDLRGDDDAGHIGTMMARHLWNAIGTLLRVTDGIYVLGPDHCAVLMPSTSCEEARHIWERLDEDLAATFPEELYRAVQVEFLDVSRTDAREALACLVGEPATEAAGVQGGST